MSDSTGLRHEFLLDPSVTFLYHGSFGTCPRAVFERYQEWQLELERQPVLFLARRLGELLADARDALGTYVGADSDDLIFVPNATAGVNIAAWAIGLQPGDVVLATDLEYGALDLTWEHVGAEFGATYVRAPIRLPVTSHEEIVETVWSSGHASHARRLPEPPHVRHRHDASGRRAVSPFPRSRDPNCHRRRTRRRTHSTRPPRTRPGLLRRQLP